MIERGLSGASEPPPSTGEWPPGPPSASSVEAEPPASENQPESEPEYGLEYWRHPVSIDRKELWESGLEFVGPKLVRAFESNGQSVRLIEEGGRLAVNEVEIVSASEDFHYLEITQMGTGATFSIAAPTWALAVALHDGYLEPMDPDRSWQMGFLDGTTVLFLARPEEIDAIGRRSSLQVVADLAKLSPG